MARAAALPVALTGLLLASALAGCLGAGDANDPLPDPVALLAPAAEALWAMPQYEPHPMFNFPTLTNPAVGGTVPAWWQPIEARPLPSPVAGLEAVGKSPEEVRTGAGMAVFGSLAIVPGYNTDTSILDIRDPANPVVLGMIPDERHRNVDTIAYPDGRLVAVFSETTKRNLTFWDITDPTMPALVGEVHPPMGIHKVNIVPGTPIVYNGNSRGGDASVSGAPVSGVPRLPTGQVASQGAGLTEIYDLTDPANPVLVQEWKNGFGCHHIYFWHSAEQEKYRAICAGIEYTQIWDTADPRNPMVIVNIPVHHGAAGTPSGSVSGVPSATGTLAANGVPVPGVPLPVPVSTTVAFSHFSILSADGTVLIVGDEMGGGGGFPGCGARNGDASTPLGALWFYDVSNEKDPEVKGWFSPGHQTQYGTSSSCTAHHGRLVPDPERDLLAMAFYAAGVVLVDFTDPARPRLVDQFHDATDTWEVQYYNGYLFTGDLSRGMDVLTLR